MSTKQTLVAMSIAYLVLTVYLFLSPAGIDVVLLFAIFSYIFYTPLTAIFKYDIDYVESEELGGYIRLTAYILIGYIFLYATGIFSAETFLKIMKYVSFHAFNFKLSNIMPSLKDMDLVHILLLIAFIIVFRMLILYIIGIAILIYLLTFVFNIVFGLLVITIYLLISIGILSSLVFVAYKGRAITKRYVKDSSQEALIFFSTIGSGIYLVLVFYINLFTIG